MLLFHRDLGGAGLPPLVLLHGLLGSSRNWQTAGAELALSRHVLAVDLRNHGGSPHAEPMTYEAMAADVVGWMDSRGLDRVSLLGHSMGGKVAMRIACSHPGRIERLIVVEVAPRAYPAGRWSAEFVALQGLDLGRLTSRSEAERLIEPAVPDWAMRKFLMTNLLRLEGGGWRWMVNLPALAESLPEILRNPLGPGDVYPGPALFVAGGKSGYVQPGDGEAIRRHFPEARIEVIPEAGHNPHMEARAAFVRTVA
jgi:pimeloyl-ACP methyl ester carboxylesterase